MCVSVCVCCWVCVGWVKESKGVFKIMGEKAKEGHLHELQVSRVPLWWAGCGYSVPNCKWPTGSSAPPGDGRVLTQDVTSPHTGGGGGMVVHILILRNIYHRSLSLSPPSQTSSSLWVALQCSSSFLIKLSSSSSSSFCHILWFYLTCRRLTLN